MDPRTRETRRLRSSAPCRLRGGTAARAAPSYYPLFLGLHSDGVPPPGLSRRESDQGHAGSASRTPPSPRSGSAGRGRCQRPARSPAEPRPARVGDRPSDGNGRYWARPKFEAGSHLREPASQGLRELGRGAVGTVPDPRFFSRGRIEPSIEQGAQRANDGCPAPASRAPTRSYDPRNSLSPRSLLCPLPFAGTPVSAPAISSGAQSPVSCPVSKRNPHCQERSPRVRSFLACARRVSWSSFPCQSCSRFSAPFQS